MGQKCNENANFWLACLVIYKLSKRIVFGYPNNYFFDVLDKSKIEVTFGA